MADDEADYSKTTAAAGVAPVSLHGTPSEEPVSGEEDHSAGEPEAAEAKSQPELEATAAEAEPPEAVSPGTHTQSEEYIPSGAEALESASAPEPARFSPQGDSPNAPGPVSAKPRSRFPALAATALIGGILGVGGSFALHHFRGAQPPGASEDRIAALSARIDSIESNESKAQGDAAAARTALASLETRVAAAESAANKAAESAESAQAGVQKALESQPAAQEPAAGSNASEGPDLKPFNARIGTIEQKLSSLESALTAPKAELRAHQQDRESPVAKQDAHAQAIAIVAESLLLKLESGGQVQDELAALENLGIPAGSLAPLHAVSASAAPSERELAAQFTALAPEIIASDPANQASADENFLDRVTRHAKGLVHVHRVGGAEDTDVEGLVARIEKALTDHDLDAAYKTWSELPSVATAKSQGWGEAVKARLDALNAARSIEADAVAVLGKPKS
jgi:hypothetical protein